MPDVLEGPETSFTLTSVVLDPSEVASERVELNINSGPIRVLFDGPDWGDAAIQAYMAEQAMGEIPVDFRIPNRQVKLPLLLGGNEPANFASAMADLQQKVALIQREGGWLKRGSLYADIVNASLVMPDKYGHLNFETDIILSLECIPDFYGDEVDLGTFSETSAAEFIHVYSGISGDHPSRTRIVVTDLQGQSQLGLIWGIRSRYYDDAATARLAYEAEALTALDAAAIATITGSSGGGSNNVIRHQALSTSWTPVCSTYIAGVGDMTHKGTYRLMARLYSASGATVQARSVWDVGDLALPAENAPWRFPAASQHFVVDLGEVRLDPSPVGTHRWQGVIQAKGDVGGESISVDKVWLVPVDEGMGKLVAVPTGDPGLSTFSAREEFNQAAGVLTAKTLPVGGTWGGSGDADDFSVETAGHTAQRTAISDTSTPPEGGRVMTASTPSLSAVLVQADFKWSYFPTNLDSPYLGLIFRRVDASNQGFVFVGPEASGKRMVRASKLVAGATTMLSQDLAAPLAANAWYTLRVAADVAGRIFVWLFPKGGSPGSPVLTATDSAFATGGTLATGKVGFFDQNQLATASTRSVDDWFAAVPTLDAVLFANRTAELRSEAMVRQDSAGVANGPVSQVIGDLPRVPPAGLEDRSVELFVKASRGDFGDIPDSSSGDDLAVRVYRRPSWLFPTGA